MGEQQVRTLSYSVRIPVMLKQFGRLCVALSAFALVGLVVSLLSGEYSFTYRYAAVVIIFAVSGLALVRIKAPSDLQINEAIVISALIFPFSSLVFSYPMMASGLPFSDALFESISAVTTTGLSTVGSVEDKPATFLFGRAWLQWTGGLGIVVLTVALLTRPDVAVKRLIEYEEFEDIVGGTRLFAQKVLKVYLILTALGIIILVLTGVRPFQALVHTLAAVSTGGFSSYDNSLAGLDNWTSRASVILISFLGAISLALYYRAYYHGWRRFFSDVQVQALAGFSFIVSLLLFFFMGYPGTGTWESSLRDAPLMAFSAQTTTGFSSLPVSALDPVAKLLLIMSMAVGGGIGSTAGGMKILRLLILFKLLALSVMRTCLPAHAVTELRISGQKMEADEIERTLLMILLFFIVIFLSWLPFLIMGYGPLDALFEVVSAVGTVGLSTGITDSRLPAVLKGVLCADMLLGRLEIFAFLVVFYPGTWFGRRIS
jgi:trk system potassium uptake protein TrkH